MQQQQQVLLYFITLIHILCFFLLLVFSEKLQLYRKPIVEQQMFNYIVFVASMYSNYTSIIHAVIQLPIIITLLIIHFALLT